MKNNLTTEDKTNIDYEITRHMLSPQKYFFSIIKPDKNIKETKFLCEVFYKGFKVNIYVSSSDYIKEPTVVVNNKESGYGNTVFSEYTPLYTTEKGIE